MLEIIKKNLLPLFEEALRVADKHDIDLEEQDLSVTASYLHGRLILTTENPNYVQYSDNDEEPTLFLAGSDGFEAWRAEYLSDEPSCDEAEFFEMLKLALAEVLTELDEEHEVELYSLLVNLDGFDEVDLTEERDDVPLGEEELAANISQAQSQAEAQLEQMSAMYANMPGIDMEAIKAQMNAQMQAQMTAMNSLSLSGIGDDDDDDELFPMAYNPAGSTLTDAQKKMIAYGAPLNVMNHHFLDTIITGESIDIIREQLESWWEIVDEESAVKILTWLLEEGHSKERNPILSVIANKDIPWNKRVVAIHNSVENAEQATAMEGHYFGIMKMLRYMEGRGGLKSITQIPTSICAWDYVRCVSMSRLCYDAGFINEARMWEIITATTARIEAEFPSLAEYGASFAFGRGVWRYDTSDLKIGDLAIRSLFDTEENTPWR